VLTLVHVLCVLAFFAGKRASYVLAFVSSSDFNVVTCLDARKLRDMKQFDCYRAIDRCT